MSNVLNATRDAVEIGQISAIPQAIDGLEFRQAVIDDAVQCAALIYASGKREFDYFLGVPSDVCILFLDAAFRSSAGRFSWRRHHVAIDAGGAVLALLAAQDGRRMRWDDLHIAWMLARFFGIARAVRILLRGLILERELPKPSRNQTLMAHCATVVSARSRGVFSALFRHALESGVFSLGDGRELVLDVLISNHAASALYERLGFVAPAGERTRSRGSRLPSTLRSTRMAMIDVLNVEQGTPGAAAVAGDALRAGRPRPH